MLGIYLIPTAVLYLFSTWAATRRGELSALAQIGLQVSPVWIFPSLVFALAATASFPVLLPAYLCLLLPVVVHVWRVKRISLPAAIVGSLLIALLCNAFIAAPAVTTPRKLLFGLSSTLALAVCAMPLWTLAGFWRRLCEAQVDQQRGWALSASVVALLALFVAVGVGIFVVIMADAFN